MITSEEKFKTIKATGEAKSCVYHHCTKKRKDVRCRQPSITHDELKQKIEAYLDAMTIHPEILHLALQVLREQNQIEETDRHLILKNLQEEQTKCTKRIDNLPQMFISPENTNKDMLSDGEFRLQKSAIVQEQLRLEEEIKKFYGRNDEWMELTERTFHFATYAKYWFEKGDYETKTIILRSLGQNLVLKDGKLSIEIHKPFESIKSGVEAQKSQMFRLELMDLGSVQTEKQSLDDCFSTWSG